MPENVSTMVDLTRDLQAASGRGARPEDVDRLLAEALDALQELVPYELATIMELEEGELLKVRLSRGTKAGPRVDAHRLDLSAFPSLREVLRRGRARAFVEEDHADGDGDPFDGVLDLPHGHACMVVPLKVHDATLGVMTLDHSRCGVYPAGVVQMADVVGKLLALALSYGEQSQALEGLLDQLRERHRILQESLERNDAGHWLERSRSPRMRRVVELSRQVAPTATPVLLTGETGTGKGVLAEAIHGWSDRSARPFVSLNCAALPATLIETELFGHVKGAFSGATQKRLGRFQAAGGGTLFLDEIGELPLDLQAKLLRVIQDGTFEPVGSDRTTRVDVRVVAATNRNLLEAVQSREFREDLYYRLAVFPIELPPLRDRVEDILPAAEIILDRLANRAGRAPWRLSPGAVAHLEGEAWPGNVRELGNVLERATVLATGPVLGAELFSPAPSPQAPRSERLPTRDELLPLAEHERQYIERVLTATAGQIAGKGGAAEVLDIPPSTLRSRMKKLGVRSG